MSKMDELVAGINPNKKSPSKEKLWEFIRESLGQINEINDAYKKYFDGQGEDESKTVFEDIELKIEKIKQSYVDLFGQGDSGLSHVEEINKQVEEIKKYHIDLVVGESSVKSDVEEAQRNIVEFYEYLFGKDEENGIEPDVREAIDIILKSKKEITDFETHISGEIKPLLVEVQDDIMVKRKEINALLSNATGSTLAEAYAGSKHEYSIPVSRGYEEKKWFKNTDTWLFNNIVKYLGTIFNYTLFILPLVSVSLIFTNEKIAQIIMASLVKAGRVPNVMELIYVKSIISIPLIWIAWYGQRNISQRKRLSEEYNHKLRVVQMYLMFITNESSYQLKDKKKLENTLLDAIARNPSEIYGRDETMLDKIAEIFRVIKQKPKEIISEVKDGLGSNNT